MRGSERGGLRPVLIISHDILNRRSGTVIALAITSKEQRAGYPFSYRLPTATLPKDSWVKMTQVRTISTERLRDRIVAVEPNDLAEIIEGLIEVVG